ncbi:hypothetical protein WKV44_04710 [Spirochaetia bacterium 38H-sp]|uniref:DUF1097 domain-containing protein n=1 Tax=Rarispira pelagica TaxID=3141764 RepID=A0ABU9UB02_9SPIR
MASDFSSDELYNERLSNVRSSSAWVGAAAGTAAGMINMWLTIYDRGFDGAIALTTIPPVFIAAFVGYFSTQWAAVNVTKNCSYLFMGFLQGIFWGAVDGVIIAFSAYLPLFIIGELTGTINFNFDNSTFYPLQLLGTTVLGSVLYGGVYGAVCGAVGGPVISLYMRI